MIWIATATIFMQTLNAFRFGVRSIIEMDKALTDLSKVVEFTDKELNDMKDSAIELGKELGKSGVEIMNAYAEFGRVTKVKEEIEELARTATMASNVSEMTADSAAKAINTTMIAFQIGAKDSMKILDGWNELQNNFRVSATDMADAIGGIGTTARQAGIELDELNGYVASIAGATGLSGLI